MGRPGHAEDDEICPDIENMKRELKGMPRCFESIRTVEIVSTLLINRHVSIHSLQIHTWWQVALALLSIIQ